MTSAELITLLQDPETRESIRHTLGLPSESVAEALRELAEAQARTDASLEKLAAAQARTDVSLEKLSAAQARTDASLEKLSAAHQELAAEVKELASSQRRGFDELRQAVGRLSDNVGYGLEELAAIALPGVLERDEGVKVDRFTRRWFVTEAGEEEIDVFAEGDRNGMPVAIIGEVKSRIDSRDVKKLAQKLGRIAPGLSGRPLGLMFGFVVHPSATGATEEAGVRVIASRPAA